MKTNINRALSRKVALRVNAVDKACWNNALLGSIHLGEGARYVEGWVVTDLGLVAEHGWIEWCGEVVDPTPCYHERERGAVYFPGRYYDGRDIDEQAGRKLSVTLPLVRWDNPLHRAAYSAAFEHAYGLTPEAMQEKLAAAKGGAA